MLYMEKKLSAEEISERIKEDIPNTPTVGYKLFQPENSLEELSEIENHLKATEDLVSYKKLQKLGCLSQANWCPDVQMAEVTHQVGSHCASMGHTENKRLYLYPEEALYLLEMGVLELKYNGLPISVQRAYSILLQPVTSVTEDCYRVFSELHSHGYKVMRHIQSNTLTKYEKQLQIHKACIKRKICSTKSRTENTRGLNFEENNSQSLEDIFPIKGEDLNDLQIFQSYKSGEPSNLNIHYDVYLPSDGKNSFKKAYFQLPKVRIVVHRGNDPMPDLKDIQSLSQQYQDDVPIIHAVVFPEFITFYNITPVITPKYALLKSAITDDCKTGIEIHRWKKSIW